MLPKFNILSNNSSKKHQKNKIAEDNDAAMLYLAKELSEATYQEEEDKRRSREIEYSPPRNILANNRPSISPPPPGPTGDSSNGYPRNNLTNNRPSISPPPPGPSGDYPDQNEYYKNYQQYMQYYSQQQQQGGAGYNPYYAQQMQQYYAYQQYVQNQQAMYTGQVPKQKAVSKAPEESTAITAKLEPSINRQIKPPLKDRSFAGKVDEYGIPIVDTNSSKINPTKLNDSAAVKKKMSFSYDEFGIPLIDAKPNKSGKIESKPVAHSFDPDDPYCGIIDPDVRAFMEKRKLREQQRKEEKLKKELEEEAKKMFVNPEKVVEKAQEILNSRSGTISNVSSTDPSAADSAARAAQFARGIEPDALRASRTPSTDEEFAKAPLLNGKVPSVTNPANDPSHILHNSNVTAFKAAAALFQLAKKHPTVTSQSKDLQNQAATQLAGLWINQTAYYLSKIDATRDKANSILLKAASRDPSDRPVITPPPVHINIPKETSYNPYNSGLATKVSPKFAAITAKQMLTRKSSLSSSNNSSIGAVSSQGSNTLKKISSSSSMRKDVIDLMSNKLSDNIKSKGIGENPTLLRKSRSSSMYNVLDAIPQRGKPPTPKSSNNDTWECKVCTLLNKPTFLVCEACGTQRKSL